MKCSVCMCAVEGMVVYATVVDDGMVAYVMVMDERLDYGMVVCSGCA